MDLTTTTSSKRAPRRLSMMQSLLVIGVAVLVMFAYTQGTFDNFLWKVGLNYNECATNGFGATFCGDALTDYKVRIGQK